MSSLTFVRATTLHTELIESFWLRVLTHAFTHQAHPENHRPEDELRFKMRQFHHAMASSTAHVFLAFEGTQLIGTIAYESPPNRGILRRTNHALKDLYEIGSLYIEPTLQNRGYGKKLLMFILQEVQKAGIETVCFDSILEHSQKMWLKIFGEARYIFPSDDQTFVVYIWVIDVDDALDKLTQIKH